MLILLIGGAAVQSELRPYVQCQTFKPVDFLLESVSASRFCSTVCFHLLGEPETPVGFCSAETYRCTLGSAFLMKKLEKGLVFLEVLFKVQCAGLGKDVLIRGERQIPNDTNRSSLLSRPNNKRNKHTDLTGQHNFIQFYFAYMWRTLPPFELQTEFWGTLFSSESSLLTQLWEKINISEFVLIPH